MPGEIDFQSMHREMVRSIMEMQRSLYKTVEQTARAMPTLGSPGLINQMMAPQGGDATKAMRRSMGNVGKEMEKGLSKAVQGAGKGMKNASKGADDLKKSIKAAAKEAASFRLEVEKAMKALQKPSRLRRVGGSAWRGMKGALSLGAQGAGFIGKSLVGFMTGAFQRGVANYEQTAMARLSGAPYMTAMAGGYGEKGANYRSDKYVGGGKWGYNLAESAVIQAQAARLGMGGGGTAARTAMQLQRGLGQEGVQWGATLMRHQGLTGKAGGAQKMIRQLSEAMAIGVKTGLDEARVGELLQAANDYAEQQIRQTPDNNQWKLYIREMGMIQQRGGPGLRGRYGAAAMQQIDQAMKGAGGVQQSFLMRAFGFGKGTSFLKALRRQEAGAFGRGPGDESNMMSVMKMLRQEYGAGKHGGLSQQGLLAFKGMGFGTTSMAEKFGQIYLQRKSGEISAEDARKKVRQIEEKEKIAKMPAIQRKAYEAMDKFGSVAQNLAKQYAQFVKFGKDNYEIKQLLINFQKKALGYIKPMIKSVKKLAESVIPLLDKTLPVVAKLLGYIVEKLALFIRMMTAFASGYSKGGISGAFNAMSSVSTEGEGKIERDKEQEKMNKAKRQAWTMMKPEVEKQMSSYLYSLKSKSLRELKKQAFLSNESLQGLRRRQGDGFDLDLLRKIMFRKIEMKHIHKLIVEKSKNIRVKGRTTTKSQKRVQE